MFGRGRREEDKGGIAKRKQEGGARKERQEVLLGLARSELYQKSLLRKLTDSHKLKEMMYTEAVCKSSPCNYIH